VTAYTLVKVEDNQPDEVVYYGTSLSTIVTGLSSDNEYFFRVKASNLVGDGPWSS